jgi:hypothetical protein
MAASCSMTGTTGANISLQRGRKAATSRSMALLSTGGGTWEDADNKGRHKFPYGDFENIHRCGVLSAEVRAAQYKHTDIEVAAAHLHGMLDELMSLKGSPQSQMRWPRRPALSARLLAVWQCAVEALMGSWRSGRRRSMSPSAGLGAGSRSPREHGGEGGGDRGWEARPGCALRDGRLAAAGHPRIEILLLDAVPAPPTQSYGQ